MESVDEQGVDRKQRPHCNSLSPTDRRLLLSANLQFLLHRVRHSQPITSGELASLVSLADDLEAAI